MLPIPDSLLERSFYSQLEINSPSSSNPTTQPDFPFSYPSPTFLLEAFPPPPLGLPINSQINSTTNLESIQRNLNTENTNSKRVARKDRHSKINTAAGLRDRRMRLSLDVARKFFDLQDMLGFDKASKTVQWLLTKSKSAIKEITGSRSMNSDNKNASSDNGEWPESDCEDASTVSDSKQKVVSQEKRQKVKKSSVKAPRKTNVHQAVDKEARAKARERARERTIEKNRLRWVTIASSIAVEGMGEGSGSHGYTNYTSSNLINEIEERSSSSVNRYKQAVIEQPHVQFSMGNEATNMPVFDYTGHEIEGNNYDNIPMYQGQWDIEGAHFPGMQYHSRPW